MVVKAPCVRGGGRAQQQERGSQREMDPEEDAQINGRGLEGTPGKSELMVQPYDEFIYTVNTIFHLARKIESLHLL